MNPIARVLAEQIAAWHVPGPPLIVGLCGTQASGKSTACAQLRQHFGELGLRVGLMSLDDLYLGRAARAKLAEDVHPLFATRGPPGTHDATLGLHILDAVKAGEPVRLPRFSKALDEPLPERDWPLLEGCDLFLFEGWCIGARPQPDAALSDSVNDLEREEDADGVWRRAVNAHLAGSTAELFSRIDRLAYLRPPSFDVVYRWRCQQEHEMIDRPTRKGVEPVVTAKWNGEVIAESDDTVIVEGNHYFPRDAVRADVLSDSATTSICPWKGTAHYHSVSVKGETNPDAAWYYPDPKPAASEIRDRIAFWRGVEVS